MQKLIIPTELTDLNTYINSERTNRYAAAKIKKDNTELCALYAKCLMPVTQRTSFIFNWYLPNTRKDPDNVAFARKFVLDGLVQAGILQNDGQKQISAFEDNFYIDKKNPRVEVIIKEGE